jgi:hypothetical protein
MENDGKPWENHGKPWENHRKTIGKPRENDGKSGSSLYGVLPLVLFLAS